MVFPMRSIMLPNKLVPEVEITDGHKNGENLQNHSETFVVSMYTKTFIKGYFFCTVLFLI